MISKYKCLRCNYETNKYSNHIKHLQKKNPCSKNILSYCFSDDQLFIQSILPVDDNLDLNDYKKYPELNNEDEDQVEIICNKSSILYYNRNEIIEIFSNIHQNHIKKCIYCNRDFEKIQNLKKHILINCFSFKQHFNKKSLGKNEDEDDDEGEFNNIELNNSLNNPLKYKSKDDYKYKIKERGCETEDEIEDETEDESIPSSSSLSESIFQQEIDIEINSFENNSIIPFDDDWDLQFIKKETILYCLLQKNTYTYFLKEIFIRA
jgi:hypothetical protein